MKVHKKVFWISREKQSVGECNPLFLQIHLKNVLTIEYRLGVKKGRKIYLRAVLYVCTYVYVCERILTIQEGTLEEERGKGFFSISLNHAADTTSFFSPPPMLSATSFVSSIPDKPKYLCSGGDREMFFLNSIIQEPILITRNLISNNASS